MSILKFLSLGTPDISLGELTFHVGESTSYVGELVVGELTRWRNDRYSWKVKAVVLTLEFASVFKTILPKPADADENFLDAEVFQNRF